MDLTSDGLCGMVVLHREKEDVLKVFVKREYLAVLGQFLSGVSPEVIRDACEGLIDSDVLEGYLADIEERYQDVIKWS
jgi:hypothetical protein